MAMDEATVYLYRFVLALAGLGVVAGIVAVLIPAGIALRGRGSDALKTHESGIIPDHDARRQFSLACYLCALLCLAVAVDAVFLFPVAIVFRMMKAWQVLVEVLLFVAMMGAAVVYSWRAGVFKWD